MVPSQVKQNFEVSADRANPIRDMFNAVAPRYDFLNRLLSAGCDKYWRKIAVDELEPVANRVFLDVATGTGDIAFEIRKKYKSKIIGLDLSINMLEIAKQKAKNKKIEDIKFIEGDAENLPFEDNTFDKVLISYGLRNLGDTEKGIEEFYRVLKPGGAVGVLEFFQPQSTIMSNLFKLYFNYILPWVASLFSNSKAYRYLPESVENFITPNELSILFNKVGFQKIKSRNMSFGITTILNAQK